MASHEAGSCLLRMILVWFDLERRLWLTDLALSNGIADSISPQDRTEQKLDKVVRASRRRKIYSVLPIAKAKIKDGALSVVRLKTKASRLEWFKNVINPL